MRSTSVKDDVLILTPYRFADKALRSAVGAHTFAAFPDILFEIIRKNIKKYRIQRGMTAAQLAEKAGLGHNYLRQIESEKDRHHVSLVSLYKISVALEVSIDALITQKEDQ